MQKEKMHFFRVNAVFVFAVSLLFTAHVEAVVKGVCSNCHTMHNSQNAVDMVLDPLPGESWGGECQGCHSQPREELLTLTCVGCHAKSSSSIDSPGTLDIPQVYYDGTPELAAGNFKYVTGDVSNHAKGHNVHGFGGLIEPDNELGGIFPPGYVQGMDPSTYHYFNEYPKMGLSIPQVLCAGAFGCHGDRTIQSQTKAMYGTHHAHDAILRIDHDDFNPAAQGGTAGTSYRYLKGVKGAETVNWEATVAIDDHNEYYGAVLGLNEERSSNNNIATMSEFCASCHGNFHMAGLSDGSGISSGGLNASPWIRHPTDIMIPDTPPYDSYVTYELTARVARVDLEAAELNHSATSIGTNAVVFCLSCHKAHASEFTDMLRFSYGDMVTGATGDAAGTGCFACHNDKDGS